jgi:hypothetical protein
MGRKPIYSSAAERQRAYRARNAGRPEAIPPSPPAKRRPPSRPARLYAAIKDLNNLRSEYENWRDSQPESFEETEQYEEQSEAIDLFEQALEILEQINPPLGFGRTRG